MIEVNNLTKVYGDRIAVDALSFTVNRGEVLGFLGQNGAGKTTTMKILTGFMPASSGTAKIAGLDVFEEPLEVKKKIGYLPEAPPVYREMLVSEYLRFIAELRGIPRDQRTQKIDLVLQKCHLTEVRDRLIGNLSKGYRQRVGLAQALVHDPEVLILDEPTVGLDPKQVSEARSLIRSLRSTHTVIYSTHILSEVAASCDRIVVIDRGKIVAQESLSDLGAAGGSGKTEIVTHKEAPGLVDTLRKIPGVRGVSSVASEAKRLVVEAEPGGELSAQIAKAVVESGAGLVRLAPVQLALEEYYLNLIAGRIDQ